MAKKFKLVIVIETEDDFNSDELVIYNQDEIDGFTLTRNTDSEDIAYDYKLNRADIESISEIKDSSTDKIAEIKRIINDWGSVHMGELTFCDHSPCLSSIGNGKNNVSQLIECFYQDSVTAIAYQDELELDEEEIPYEELPVEIIDEILEILKKHDALMQEEEN